MFRTSVAVIATIIAASAFSSVAEARAGGSFYASPFFRNQGMKPAVDPSIERRKRAAEEAAIVRARRLQAARESAAREAAAERRARLLAQQKAQTAKAADANDAPRVPQTAAPTSDVTVAAKREDRLPSAVASTPATTTATASANTTASTVSADPAARICRKYSAAANGIIETPCN